MSQAGIANMLFPLFHSLQKDIGGSVAREDRAPQHPKVGRNVPQNLPQNPATPAQAMCAAADSGCRAVLLPGGIAGPWPMPWRASGQAGQHEDTVCHS